MSPELKRLFEAADKAEACFVTVTILDPTKTSENLTHHTLNKRFPPSEIAGSLDACMRSLHTPRARKQRRFLHGL